MENGAILGGAARFRGCCATAWRDAFAETKATAGLLAGPKRGQCQLDVIPAHNSWGVRFEFFSVLARRVDSRERSCAAAAGKYTATCLIFGSHRES
mmetsp:Transcript_7066/g.15215  ORF Transcript_7066/g.15215 Transcript_7066/m.15215 type:complete len:96 (-) Transcript_7066:504-791(-)